MKLIAASVLLLTSPLLGTHLINGPDGVCSTAEAGLGLCFETSPGYVFEAVCGPNGEFPVIDTNGDSVFAYQVSGPGLNGVNCSNIFNISHGSMKVPVCAQNSLTIVNSSSNLVVSTNGTGDGSCNFGVGDTSVDIIKWDVEVDCNASTTWSITYAGNVAAELTEFLTKDGVNCRINTILGPSCSDPFDPFCQGDVHCPCGNYSSDGGGCLNSTGAGGKLTASGSTSVGADDLVLQAYDLPPNQFGIFLYAKQDANPILFNLGSGTLCLAGQDNKVVRIKPIVLTSAAGTVDSPPNLVAISCSGSLGLPSITCITAGETFNFQLYYRDLPSTLNCTEAQNLTNAVRVMFTN
ncbi:MAG: hypothetical protein ACI87O_002574 [Planctomycetota bacterium]|jgi:hypothetical protein